MSELTSKQKRACEILVANPTAKLEDIAKELEVNSSTLWRWRQTPEFRDYQHELCQLRFKDLERVAVLKLQENALNNNQKAIEYILNYIGYKPAEEIKADVSTDIVVGIEE